MPVCYWCVKCTITKSDVKRHLTNVYAKLSYIVVEYSISYTSHRMILRYLREEKQRDETAQVGYH